MTTSFRLNHNRLHLEHPGSSIDGHSRNLDAAAFAQFERWSTAYREALGHKDAETRLLTLGRDLYTWLDRDGWLQALLPEIAPPWQVTFQIPARPGTEESAFLNAPWELLADASGHLAADLGVRVCPVRRLGAAGTPVSPSDYRLSLAFMAAAPRGQQVLDYEAEEVAILDATEHSGLDLTVEETGELDQLADTLGREGPMDVLHLSCHGGFDGERPVLFLEQETGEPDPVDVVRLITQPAIGRVKLLFLSACHTADEEVPLAPLTQQLLQGGILAVLGWGGAVGDAEASEFAASLYRSLAQHIPLAEALAAARFALLNRGADRPASRDWHLARLYLSAKGGGVLARGTVGRHRLDSEAGHKEFLDTKGQKVLVASRREFVGRRRQTQDILRTFRGHRYKGLLIHGMGRQGKSSLAARVANRLPNHNLLVVYGQYEAADILAAFARFSEDPEVAALVERYQDAVRSDPPRLEPALKELLAGPCRQAVRNADGALSHHPILLVIDDLEQILQEPAGQGLHRIGDPAQQAALAAVIRAFNRTDTDSRLLLTSRYRFWLPDLDGKDLLESLLAIHLPPMEPVESRKQAQQRIRSESEASQRAIPLLNRAIEAARGNPGLQDLLFRILLADPDVARETLDAIERWLAGGDMPEAGPRPETEELRQTLEDLVLETLVERLQPAERDLLAASTLFELPVPLKVLGRLAIGGERTASRLLAFGLWDAWPDPVDGKTPCAAINPLAYSVTEELSQTVQSDLACLIAAPLYDHWTGPAHPPLVEYELLRLAVLASEGDIIHATGEAALNWLYTENRFIEAAHWGIAAAEQLMERDQSPSPMLLRWTADACIRVGETEAARGYFERALDAIDQEPDQCTPYDHAALLLSTGRLLIDDGRPDEAFVQIQTAHDLFDKRDHARERAVTLGDIARIKVSKGEVEDALKLHQEELTVYEALGDQRSRAVTLGDIARIKVDKGEVEDALKLHQERLSVFEALGDQRERAVTLGDIARIKVDKGEVEDALKLHQERLSVFEALGDQRSRSVTLFDLAQIALGQQDYQQAFDYLAESYSIAAQLGDASGIANVGLYLGQLLIMSGSKDDGLTVLERSLEQFERLGQTAMAQQVAALMAEMAR